MVEVNTFVHTHHVTVKNLFHMGIDNSNWISLASIKETNDHSSKQFRPIINIRTLAKFINQYK